MNRMAALSGLLAIAAAAPGAVPIQPGLWQSVITVTDAQLTGGPPGLGALLRGRSQTDTGCVTAADAARGPRGTLERSGGHCRFTRYAAVGARIAGTLVCTQRSGDTITSQVAGSFTATSYDMTGTSTVTGRVPMQLTSRIVGRRTGAC